MRSSAPIPSGDDPLASVLIVDDHPANLTAVESILAPLRLDLVLVGSGEEALRQLLRKEFALILLDVQMAGLDGLKTAALIKQAERTRHIPIIFLTAFSSDASQVFKAYREGAVDYLLKPFEPEALRAKVAVFVDLFVQSDRLRRQTAQLLESTRLYEQERGARAEAESAATAREHVLEVVSHDLRTPLSSIHVAAELLLRTLPPGDEARRYRRQTEVILRSAERMNRLIEDLLDVSRMEGGRLSLARRPVPSGQLLQQAIELIRPQADQRGLAIAVQDAAGTTVTCDADRLNQVLSNLLGNALKHTPPQGEITLAVRVERDEVVFTVADTGPGISREQLPHIFQRYWQARAVGREGLGLGLAIAKGIVEAHGGRIWVTSRPGEGATFSFSIPLGQAARTRGAASDALSTPISTSPSAAAAAAVRHKARDESGTST